MRIAIIDPSNFTLPYDRALGRALAARGHTVTMIGRPPDAGDGWEEPGIPFVPHFYRGLDRLRRLPRPLFLAAKGAAHAASMAGLRQRLADLRPDVIHVQWFPLPAVDRLLLPALRRIAPVVLTMHDTEPFNGNPTSILQRLGALDLPRACDGVIVHTALGVRRLTAAGVSPERIAVVPHGLLGEVPGAAPPPDGPPLFLLIGKIKPYKGADLFVEAIARMPQSVRQGCRFVIAGRPYIDTAPLLEAARRHGLGDELRFDFRFLSEAEMAALIAEASVLVFPYREIEASGVLATVLGHGRAVVATAVGGFAETLTDGVTARLVPPGDAGALAAALAGLATDPAERERLGQAARMLAGRLQDWGAIADRTAAVYTAARRDWSGAAGAPVRASRP